MSSLVRISPRRRVIGGLSAVLIPATVAGLLAVTGGISVPTTPGAWLDRIEARLLAASGEVIEIAAAEEDAPLLGIYYAPLSAFWRVEEVSPDLFVTRSGLVLREEEGFSARLRILWVDGTETTYDWPGKVPEITGTGEPHRLATLHDALLAGSLQSPLAGLPAGSRFGADGIVHVPGEATPPALWQSLGNTIMIDRLDGTGAILRVEDVVAAIDPAQPAETEP